MKIPKINNWNPNESSFLKSICLQPYTEDDIIRIIAKLKMKATCVSDEFPTFWIKKEGRVVVI